MPDNEPPTEDITLPNVPVIPAPTEDDIDNAASLEAADIGAGRYLCA
jgi:hypothetical protein